MRSSIERVEIAGIEVIALPHDYISRADDAPIIRDADGALPCSHFVVRNVTWADQLVGSPVFIGAVLFGTVRQQRLLRNDASGNSHREHLFVWMVSIFHFCEKRTIRQNGPMHR